MSAHTLHVPRPSGSALLVPALGLLAAVGLRVALQASTPFSGFVAGATFGVALLILGRGCGCRG